MSKFGLNFSRKNSFLSPSVPLVNPAIGTQRLVAQLEILAWCCIFPFFIENFLTTVKVHIMLEAVVGLIRLWKPWIKRYGLEILDSVLDALSFRHDASAFRTPSPRSKQPHSHKALSLRLSLLVQYHWWRTPWPFTRIHDGNLPEVATDRNAGVDSERFCFFQTLIRSRCQAKLLTYFCLSVILLRRVNVWRWKCGDYFFDVCCVN